jgi:hypothetical protein
MNIQECFRIILKTWIETMKNQSTWMRVNSEIMIIQTWVILSINEYISMNDRSLSKISTTTSQIQIEKDVAKNLNNLIHSMNDENSNESIDATIEWVVKCWIRIICDWWNKTSFMKLVNSIVTKHLHDKNKWENYARFFCHDFANINFKLRIRIKDCSIDFYLYQVFVSILWNICHVRNENDLERRIQREWYEFEKDI